MFLKIFLRRIWRFIALRTPGVALLYFRREYQHNLQRLGEQAPTGATNPAAPQAKPLQSNPLQPNPLQPNPLQPNPLQQHRAANVQVAEAGRLFYVSPLPPDQSGIARYSHELLPHLAHHQHIVLVHPSLQSLLLDGREVPVRTPQWMLSHIGQHDKVLYHIGNSAFHTYMLELMLQCPGDVVLHDVYLSHLLYHEFVVNGQASLLVQHLQASHGLPAMLDVWGTPGLGHRILNYPCSGLVVQQARQVFVYSQHARQLIAQHFGPALAGKVQVLNMPMVAQGIEHRQAMRPQARQQLNIAEGTLLVCCFGIVQSFKRCREVLDAWLALGWNTHADKKLVFVGGYNPKEAYAKAMLDLLASLPAAHNNIQLIGWVDDAQYEHYLHACDLAVQLRSNSRGETSAALLNTLAFGVPSIVNAHGSMAELPAEVVHMLPDEFSGPQLQQALAQLAGSPAELQRLSTRAAAHVQQAHAPGLLMQQFSALLNATDPPQPAPAEAPSCNIWVDASILFNSLSDNPSQFQPQLQAFQQLALQVQHSRLQVQFVHVNLDTQQFETCIAAYGLQDTAISQAYKRSLPALQAPQWLVVHPAMKLLAKGAVEYAMRHHQPRLVYSKPSALSTLPRLCDQVITGKAAGTASAATHS